MPCCAASTQQLCPYETRKLKPYKIGNRQTTSFEGRSLCNFPVVRALLSLHSLLLLVSFRPAGVLAQAGVLGIFEGHSDIGSVVPPGKFAFDSSSNAYTISAAGENMWLGTDAYSFAWKKVSGDISLSADIEFPVATGNPNPHRKAVLILRQSLDADSVYADAALHGSGLTALQYRPQKGGLTQDVELNIDAPKRIRIEKRGDVFTMFLSMNGEPLHPAGASIRLHLEGPFYAGLGVCSHNKDVTERAVFSNLELKPLPPETQGKLALYSTLQTISVGSTFGRALMVYTARSHFEAPNWTHDGQTLIVNQDGRIFKIPAEGGTPVPLDTGAVTNCNGSHGISPDGKSLAISCSPPGGPGSRVYMVPLEGGTPRVVTENAPSYWHGWSPDGKTILFTRPRDGGNNIFAIPAEGGKETQLTFATGKGVSDDPDYSPDGQFIYFNSDRNGAMQIWRMRPDGSQPEQVTSDDRNNWSPHPSPDGKWIVFLTYEKGITGHPANKEAVLRLMSLGDKKVTELVTFLGGQGTMNVNSWARDSQHLAFIGYALFPEDAGGQ